jgi:anti-sigma-K factor RskA
LVGAAGFGYALAAALLIIAIGLGAWGLSRGGGNEEVIYASASADGASLQLTYIREDGLAVLDVELPAPPDGSVYQAWQVRDGVPVSMGVLDIHSGHVPLLADLTGATAVALSVEPAGGSQSPTSDPVLTASLDG